MRSSGRSVTPGARPPHNCARSALLGTEPVVSGRLRRDVQTDYERLYGIRWEERFNSVKRRSPQPRRWTGGAACSSGCAKIFRTWRPRNAELYAPASI
jgi:hypothetical protein